jgi:drug/metabolite transporter (DMT)-like permease
MEPVVAALVLTSAALHPVRELLLKQQSRPESAYLAMTVIWLICAVVHTVLAGEAFVLPTTVYPVAALSILGLFFYYLCVLLAIQRGDLSIYYPIIRASPLFIVFVAWLALGEHYNAVVLVGIGLTVLGAFLLQYPGGRFLFGNAGALLPALVAMVGSGIYTIADSIAMRDVAPSTFLISIYLTLSIIFLGLFTVVRPRGRALADHLFGVWLAAPGRVLVAGAASYLSYILILTAFQLGGDVAMVSSLRQASIPFSVIVGVLVLKETQFAWRIAWSAVLAAGIAIIVTQ